MIYFVLLAITFSSSWSAMASEPCSPKVFIEKLSAKPAFRFEYESIKKESVLFNVNGNSFRGDLILPDSATPLGRYAQSLERKGHVVLVSHMDIGVTAFQHPLVFLDTVEKKGKYIPGVVFEKDALSRRVISHEGYHATSYSNVLNHTSRSHWSGKIEQKVFLNVAPDKKIVRESGEILDGAHYKQKFEAAYSSLDQEEVHTFVKDLVNRTFVNHSRKTIHLIRGQEKLGEKLDQIFLKTNEVILNPSELDAELMVVDALVKSNRDGLKLISSDYEKLKKEVPLLERGNYFYVSEDMNTHKTKVGFGGLKTEGMYLENVDSKLFSEFKKLMIERNKNKEDLAVADALSNKTELLFGKMLNERLQSGEELVMAMDQVSEDLLRHQKQKTISAKDYLHFKDRVFRLGTLVSKAKH